LDRLTGSLADKIVAVSNTVRDFAVEREGFPPGKVVVVNNGVETSRYFLSSRERDEVRENMGVSPDEFLVGNLGRLSPEKGQRCLIEAAPAVLEKFPGARFVIFGEGRMADEFSGLLEKFGLGDKFIMAGFVEETPALLGALDLFVLPSIQEGLPVGLIEALAAGVPAVVSNIPGNLEVIGDSGAAIAVSPGDASALARAIAELAPDQARRRNMGEAGRLRAREHFELDGMIKQYEALYEKILSAVAIA